MNSDVTLNVQANLDALNKSIKAINKSMKFDFGLNIKKDIEKASLDLKDLIKNNAPYADIEKLRNKLKEATKVQLKFNIDQATNQLKTLGAQLVGTYGVFKGFISKPVSSSLDFNNAINEINAFVNVGEKELEGLKKDIWDLGKNNGVSIDGIVKTAQLSAQLGVGKNELKEFSQIALNLQVGLKMSSEESVNYASKISKAFAMNTKDLEIFSDTLTQMGLVTNTSAKSILEVTKSTLAGAKAFGLSAKETSALSSAFLSVGLDSSEASSSINKFFTELNNIDNASEGFKNSLSKMGMDAQSLKEDIQNNPQKAIKELFQSMNDLDDEERFGVISEIFGKKMANNINSAKDGMRAFDKALEASKDSVGALQKAVDRVAGDGFGDLVISLGTAFKHLGVSIGNGFVPILKPVFEGIKNITNALSGFLDDHKWAGSVFAIGAGFLFLFKSAGLLAMAFRPLNTLIFYPFQILSRMLMISNLRFKTSIELSKALGKTMGGLKIAFTSFAGGISQSLIGLSNGFKLSIAWIRTFNLAMLASPAGIILMVLSAAAFLIYKFWKPIGAFFSGMFEGISESLEPLKESFVRLWNAIKGVLFPLWNIIKSVFSPLITLFEKIFGQIDSTEEELQGFAKAGFSVGRVIGGIINILSTPFKWLIDIISFTIESVASAIKWLSENKLMEWLFGGDKTVQANTDSSVSHKGLIDEVITKSNENKTKMLSSISSNDNSKQINDYKNITINTNASPQAIASAINSYSYGDDEF